PCAYPGPYPRSTAVASANRALTARSASGGRRSPPTGGQRSRTDGLSWPLGRPSLRASWHANRGSERQATLVQRTSRSGAEEEGDQGRQESGRPCDRPLSSGGGGDP